MIHRFASGVVLLLLAAGCARDADDAFVSRRCSACARPSCSCSSACCPSTRRTSTTTPMRPASSLRRATGAATYSRCSTRSTAPGIFALRSGNHSHAPARIVAANEDVDLALLRTPRHPLPTIALGSSAHLQGEIGREVGLLGYPIPDEFDDEGLGLATSLNTGRLSSIRKDALEVTLSLFRARAAPRSLSRGPAKSSESPNRVSTKNEASALRCPSMTSSDFCTATIDHMGFKCTLRFGVMGTIDFARGVIQIPRKRPGPAPRAGSGPRPRSESFA